MNESQYMNDFEEKSIDIKAEVFKYIRFWPWFLLSIIIGLIGAKVYLRYADTVYSTQATIKILNDQETNGLSFDIQNIFKRSNISLENEIAVLTSYRLFERMVDSLGLNVSYFQTGRVNTNEVFDAPVKVSYNGPEYLRKSIKYSLEITAEGYQVTNTETQQSVVTNGFSYEGDLKDFPITIRGPKNLDYKTLLVSEYNFTINPIKETAEDLKKMISVAPEGKDSDLLKLNIEYINGPRAEKILNTLIAAYEADGIRDRQEVSKRTIAFVDQRFGYILSELDSIETGKKDFKKTNNISFIEADAGLSIQNKSFKEDALFALETQQLLAAILKKSLESNKSLQLIPANIGIENTEINQLVSEYNTAVLETSKLKTSGGANNPAVLLLEANSLELKKNISRSVNGYIEQIQTNLSQSTVAKEKAKLAFSSLPEKENKLREIERQQALKEELYLLLLQKREEAAVSFAVTVSNVKVIDYARTAKIPVAPKKKLSYLTAILIGFLIPFGILYLKFLLNTKVLNLKELQALVKNTPILAEVPLLNTESENSFQNEEVFRTLISNLIFMSPKHTDKGTSVLISSSIKGEGKTFIAYNLAKGLAKNGKKVILVGADVRNPRLHQILNISKANKGLVDVIADETLDPKKFIKSNEKKTYKFDLLISGSIPPNPTTILSNPRLKEIIDQLKEAYEYVIIDSSPCLLVSDTLEFSHLADSTLMVVRSGFSERQLISFPEGLIADKKLINTAYILNGIETKNAGYGYGYGYSYNYGYGYGYSAETKKKTNIFDFLKFK